MALIHVVQKVNSASVNNKNMRGFLFSARCVSVRESLLYLCVVFVFSHAAGSMGYFALAISA